MVTVAGAPFSFYFEFSRTSKFLQKLLDLPLLWTGRKNDGAGEGLVRECIREAVNRQDHIQFQS
jgi:hypothetical protein